MKISEKEYAIIREISANHLPVQAGLLGATG
jgi:hypothetical protein